MALIDCPECAAKISERATACPHCGYPLAADRTGRELPPILAPLAEFAEILTSTLRDVIYQPPKSRKSKEEEKEKKENRPERKAEDAGQPSGE